MLLVDPLAARMENYFNAYKNFSQLTSEYLNDKVLVMTKELKEYKKEVLKTMQNLPLDQHLLDPMGLEAYRRHAQLSHDKLAFALELWLAVRSI